MKLSEIANETFAKIDQGDGELEISGAGGLDIARPGEISFLANPRYTPQLKTTSASAVFLNDTEQVERTDIAVLRTGDPYLAYTRTLRLFYPDPRSTGFVHPSAIVDDSARLGDNVEVHANAVIGRDCRIGPNTRIHANATICDGVAIGSNSVIHSGAVVRENCEIGSNCIIQSNVTVGSDGFGYAKTEDKRWLKIPQVGRVVIEDDVEIGANSAIDRASVGETRIRRGAKIDNLVQVGHSCTVGEDALICSQTGLAGSSVIGNRVVLAGQVGIAGHLRIGDDAVLTAKSATSHDVEAGRVMSGVPAFDNRDWLRSTAAFRRLGDIARKVRELEKLISRNGSA